MMSRWGLEGMQSFEQKSVARKEKSSTERVPPGTPGKLTAEDALACCESSLRSDMFVAHASHRDDWIKDYSNIRVLV